MDRSAPIQTLHLFPVLNELLIDLLRSLSSDDWNKPTLAKQWTVKDVAAHLLDTNMRTVSLLEGYSLPPAAPINSYRDLVDYLNQLNATWVNALKRVSPAQIIRMMDDSNRRYVDYYASLDPFAPAIYSVAWAGEDESLNWFHIARDYTEKWHHQQQIREAVGKTEPLMSPELYYPCISTFMRGLPHTYRDVEAEEGTSIKIIVSGKAGGSWFLSKKSGKWILKDIPDSEQDASVTLKPGVAWKLFTKGITRDIGLQESTIKGKEFLAAPLFSMVAVMA
jgi:uncharacterized protein (TIGR03083 family)